MHSCRESAIVMKMAKPRSELCDPRKISMLASKLDSHQDFWCSSEWSVAACCAGRAGDVIEHKQVSYQDSLDLPVWRE